MASKPVNPRQFALDRLDAARMYLEANDFEKAEDAIYDVMDQLHHFCSPHMKLYGPGEFQPALSRLRYALRIISSAGATLLARKS